MYRLSSPKFPQTVNGGVLYTDSKAAVDAASGKKSLAQQQKQQEQHIVSAAHFEALDRSSRQWQESLAQLQKQQEKHIVSAAHFEALYHASSERVKELEMERRFLRQQAADAEKVKSQCAVAESKVDEVIRQLAGGERPEHAYCKTLESLYRGSVERGKDLEEVAEMHKKYDWMYARRRDEGDAMAENIAKLEPDAGKAARLMGPGLWYEAEHVTEDERRAGLPDKLKAIRADLLTCARELDVSALPQFDELTQADCSKEAFTPFRRESSAMRTLWCLMQRQDVNSFLDTFTSFGGVSLIAAHGAQVADSKLTSRPQHPKRVAGFEIDEYRAHMAQQLVKDYPAATLFHQSSLDMYSMTCDSMETHCRATGALADLCTWHKFDVAMMDSYGTKWRAPEGSLYGSGERDTQELQVVRDMCQPRYLFIVNAEHHQKVLFLRWLQSEHGKDWVPLIRGASRGVGCNGAISVLRGWSVFYNTKLPGPDLPLGYGRFPGDPREVVSEL